MDPLSSLLEWANESLVLHLKDLEAGRSSDVVDIDVAEMVAQGQGVPFGYAFSGRATALRAAFWALGIAPGSEIMLPAFGSPTLPLSIIESNATPYFVDVGLGSWTIDPKSVEEGISERTGAIVVPHMAGRPAELTRILQVAQERKIPVVEDGGCAFAARYRSRPVGSFGAVAVFSVQPSVGIPGVEMGFLVTSQEVLAGRIDALNVVYEGEYSPRRDWEMMMARAQIRKSYEGSTEKIRRGEELAKRLVLIPGVEPQAIVPNHLTHSLDTFCFRLDEKKWEGVSREKILDALVKEGIPVRPVHSKMLVDLPWIGLLSSSPFSGSRLTQADLDAASARCPNARRLVECEGVSVDSHMLLSSKAEAEGLVKGLEKVFSNRKNLMDV